MKAACYVVAATSLLMACGSFARSDDQSASPATPVACRVSAAGTTYLDLAIGNEPAGRPVDCAAKEAPIPGLALATLTTPSGIRISVGRGGQIYSIRLSELADDLIPLQRRDSKFVDLVLQTVATNNAMRRASPRVRMQERRASGQPNVSGVTASGSAGWHYHQAGAYSRGQLANQPPHYSPLLADRFDAKAGVIETLNLALQAHPVPAIGERFLVYSRLQYMGEDSFKLTQAWINQSNPASGNSGILNYFNFPWLALNHTILPTVIGGTMRGETDMTDARWPPAAGDAVSGAQWVGAFSASGKRGIGIVLPRAQNDVLRAGGLRQDAVQDSGTAVEQSLFIIANVHRGETLNRGDGIIATSFLVFGDRATIANRARALTAHATVRRFHSGTTPPAATIPLCSDRALKVCPSAAARQWRIGTKLCTDCQALYELQNAAGIRYDTNPYLGSTPSNYLAQPKYRINRIVGWVPRAH